MEAMNNILKKKLTNELQECEFLCFEGDATTDSTTKH